MTEATEKIRSEAVPYRIWGQDIEEGALVQMRQSAELCIAVQGALMPDAHQGYGLPIGGVLATENAVIPYAVGVDIACRMKMTVFNASPMVLAQKREKFITALEKHTRFGVGQRGEYEDPFDHPVMEDKAFSATPFLRARKDKAWKQLGTSGSGNHFVEFGALTVKESIQGDGKLEGEGSRTFGTIPPGTYLALLSHSGSRGLGAEIADHYTHVAMNKHQDLPKQYQHLAWLDMNGDGAEYWEAMNLAGRYASANHALIHQEISSVIRMEVLGGVENHHNFAWKERLNDREVIVHRKGATPAGEGVYGVIPGSMTQPGFIVRGLGNAESLNSAAHGAGRRMSRGQALKTLKWEQVEARLKEAGVHLLSAGLDEAPQAYKDIHTVMEAQADLVQVMASFQPRIVKMENGKKERKGKRD